MIQKYQRELLRAITITKSMVFVCTSPHAGKSFVQKAIEANEKIEAHKPIKRKKKSRVTKESSTKRK